MTANSVPTLSSLSPRTGIQLQVRANGKRTNEMRAHKYAMEIAVDLAGVFLRISKKLRDITSLPQTRAILRGCATMLFL